MVAVAMLALLSVLALAFYRFTTLERQAASHLVEQARAEGIAEGGVHFAIAHLQEQALTRPFDRADEPWAVQPGVPLLDLPRLSWERNFTGPLAGLAAAQGLRCTGVTGGQFVDEGDHFLLKVVDTAAQLNLNGQQASLPEMLEVLGAEIDADGLGANPVPAGTGGAIVAFRDGLPGARFEHKTQIREAFRSIAGVTSAEADRRADLIDDFVAVHGWRDTAAAKPEATAPSVVPRATYDSAPRGRYPINVNTAPRPVLVAMLANLGGFELGVATQANALALNPNPINGNAPIAGIPTDGARLERVSVPDTDIITVVLARAVADEIIGARTATPFRSFEQVRTFLAGLGGGAALTDLQQRVVVANALPSAAMDDWNPDRCLRLGVQKTDLFYNRGTTTVDAVDSGTSEMSFSSMGFYEIESMGRVVGRDGIIAAEAVVEVVVKVFDVVRHRTERDFVMGGPLGASTTVAGSGGPLLDVEFFPEPIGALGAPAASAAIGHVGWKPFSPDPVVNPQFEADFSEGLDGASGTKVAASLLTGGGDLAPDGIVSWRDPSRERELDFDTIAFDKTAGASELFVKLATDPAEGTDEVIAVMIQDWSSDLPVPADITQHGIVWRLERYGTKLISTRSWWGFPGPARHPLLPNPIPFEFEADNPLVNPIVFSEIEFDISDWNAGEWHHVAVNWFDVAGKATPTPVLQELFVDGVRAGGFSAADGAPEGSAFRLRAVEVQTLSETELEEQFSSETSTSSGTDDFTAAGFDFNGQARVFERLTADDSVGLGRVFVNNAGGGVTVIGNTVNDVRGDTFRSQIRRVTTTTNNVTTTVITETVTRTFEVQMFQLRSNTAQDQFKLGGYAYTPFEDATIFHVNFNTGTAPKSRFTNSTIDEVRVYNGVQPWQGIEKPRYNVASRAFPATYKGRLELPPGARLGTMTFTVLHPERRDGGGAIEGVLDLGIAFGAADGDVAFDPANQPLFPAVAEGGADATFRGEGVVLGGDRVGNGGDFFYGLQWVRENSADAQNYWTANAHETPFALLDVTVTAVGSPVFLDRR